MRGPLLAMLVLAVAQTEQAIDVKHGLASSTADEPASTIEEIALSTRDTESTEDVSKRNTHPTEVPGDYKPQEITNIKQQDKLLGDYNPEILTASNGILSQTVPGLQRSAECPLGCSCSMGSELRAQCMAGDVTLTVTGSAGRYSLQCESQSEVMELFIPDQEMSMSNLTEILPAPMAPSPSVECAALPSLSPILLTAGAGLTLSVTDCSIRPPQCDAIRHLNVTALSVTDGQFPLEGATALAELGLYYHRETNTTLPSLSHLPLRSLTVNGLSLSVPVPLPRTLQRLEFSNCRLRRIDGAVFNGLDQLERLYLHGNGLEEIAGDVFTGLSSLRELGVSSNALSSLPVAALSANCPHLTAVSAFDNALVRLDSMRGLTRLAELELFYNRVPLTVSAAALSFLPNLTRVDLRESGIRELPEDLFHGSPQLRELNLAGNELGALPGGLLASQQRLRWLDLSGNRLRLLPPDFTVGLSSLRSLRLSHNALRDVTPAALAGCPHLVTLAIDGNNLTSYWIQQGVMDNMGLLLNGLRHLEVVDLSSNRLTSVPSDVTSLFSLRSLDLSRNNISDLTDLNFLATNLTVDLTHNNISSVLISPGIIKTDGFISNVVLLDDNPFICDCWLYNAVHRLKGWTHPDLDKVRLDFGKANCTAPESMKGMPIVRVREQDLICQTDKTECVEGCTCAIRPYTNALEVTCDRVPDTLPAEQVFGVTATQLTLNTIPTNLDNLTHVKVLNLSGLGMKEMPIGMPPGTLHILDLSNNSLSKIPLELLTSNLTVKLSRNPLICDCWYSDDIVKLQNFSGKVLDYDNVTCVSGEYMRSVSASQLCAAARGGIVGGSLALVGLLAAVAAALVLRYRVEVEILMTRAGLLRRKDEDDDKEYDAFVSYAFEDEDFVYDQLMPRLEGTEGLKLCIHTRDWQPGEWISSSIEQSVSRSRRTLLVMSRNFLGSRWGRLEFQAAMRETDDDRRRVIIILLEDITSHPDLDLDPELKAYLRTNTYVKWGDPWFWRKLIHALPARRDAAIRPPAHSVCASIPHNVLMAKVAATDVHPADLILAANKLNGTSIHLKEQLNDNLNNHLNDTFDCQLKTQLNAELNNQLNGQCNGKLNAAFTKQEELCDKLTDKLPPAIQDVAINVRD